MKAMGAVEMKKAMPFVQSLKKRLLGGEQPEVVFDRKLAFEEVQVLTEMKILMQRSANLTAIDIVEAYDGIVAERGLPLQAESAVSGQPTFHFENVKP
jgi:leucyl-tRNA synthetase